MMRMKSALALLLALFVLAAARPADAAVTLALAPSAQNAARGTRLVFSGTLMNTSGTAKVFLNGLQVTFADGAGNVLALEPNTFLRMSRASCFPAKAMPACCFA